MKLVIESVEKNAGIKVLVKQQTEIKYVFVRKVVDLL